MRQHSSLPPPPLLLPCFPPSLLGVLGGLSLRRHSSFDIRERERERSGLTRMPAASPLTYYCRVTSNLLLLVYHLLLVDQALSYSCMRA